METNLGGASFTLYMEPRIGDDKGHITCLTALQPFWRFASQYLAYYRGRGLHRLTWINTWPSIKTLAWGELLSKVPIRVEFPVTKGSSPLIWWWKELGISIPAMAWWTLLEALLNTITSVFRRRSWWMGFMIRTQWTRTSFDRNSNKGPEDSRAYETLQSWRKTKAFLRRFYLNQP